MLPSSSLPFDIVVFGDGSLFDEGVSNLLISDAQLNATRILYTDENTLLCLSGFNRPEVVFINEFDRFATNRMVDLIFSNPLYFVRRIIVTHIESNIFDIYKRSITDFPAGKYQCHSITIRSKEDLIDFAHSVTL